MASRKFNLSLRGIWYLVLVFLYAPLFVVVLFSFNAANTAANFTHATFKWYIQLFGDNAVIGAFEKSLILAIVSSSISTVLGTMLGYGMYTYRKRRLGWLIWLIYLPIVMPDIVYGISEMSFFTMIHHALGILAPSLKTMIIAHVSFQLPFVALLIYSRMVGLDSKLFDACHDLYANGPQRVWFFLLPLLQPAIISAFFLAFTLSIDDFVISFFTSGPESTTLPIYIWSAIKKGITPEVNAIAAVMIAAVFSGAAVCLVYQYLRSAYSSEA